MNFPDNYRYFLNNKCPKSFAGKTIFSTFVDYEAIRTYIPPTTGDTTPYDYRFPPQSGHGNETGFRMQTGG